MKVVIRFTSREEARALPVLLRDSPGTILPERTYVINEDAARALSAAGITFTELSREANTPGLEEAMPGERV